MKNLKILWEVFISTLIVLVDKFKSVKVFTVFFAMILGSTLGYLMKAPFLEISGLILTLVGLLITGNIVQKKVVGIPKTDA